MGEQVDPKSVHVTVDLSTLPAGETDVVPPAKSPEAATPVILDLVEYYTPSDFISHKQRVQYQGVVERASDGFTALRIMVPGAQRAQQIEVGNLYALTINGRRVVLQSPRDRWRIRAQEVRREVEGQIDEWAKPYFDPGFDKWFKRAPNYRDETDEEAERKYRRLILGEQPAKRSSTARAKTPEPQGCAVFLFAGAGLLLGGTFLISQLV